MLIIGIAGGSGSGKSTVVRRITDSFRASDVVVIPQDSYYRDQSSVSVEDRKKLNLDHPDAIEWDLLIEHLGKLRNGESIQQPIYSYITCTRAAETNTVHPAKIIIVEGILIFTCAKLRDLLDIKIFVDADADDRVLRIIARDTVERGKSVSDVMIRYEETVKPMHLQFIEPSKRYADIIVPQGGHNVVAIDILNSLIEKNIRHTE
ncbi:MAG: uridine kinase [Bacteroidales bacterium]|nr:uridine kinase [Bacteroidales bacterium]